jgi:hypothetical protein
MYFSETISLNSHPAGSVRVLPICKAEHSLGGGTLGLHLFKGPTFATYSSVVLNEFLYFSFFICKLEENCITAYD